jgi:hypothetical protein
MHKFQGQLFAATQVKEVAVLEACCLCISHYAILPTANYCSHITGTPPHTHTPPCHQPIMMTVTSSCWMQTYLLTHHHHHQHHLFMFAEFRPPSSLLHSTASITAVLWPQDFAALLCHPICSLRSFPSPLPSCGNTQPPPPPLPPLMFPKFLPLQCCCVSRHHAPL